jgi:Relaxase/Mobilisation nuclease domain
MARVFVLVEDETGRHTGRGSSFAVVLAYALRDAGPEDWRGSNNLQFPMQDAEFEMGRTYDLLHLGGGHHGPKTNRPVLHAILSWHSADLEWLTRDHLATTVKAALKAMRLKDHQCVWVAHTDTGRPHVHIVANLVHPETGRIARLGLTKKRMSEFCAAYELALGDVRCPKRFIPKAANENRDRVSKYRWVRAGQTGVSQPDKQKASYTPAPRP